MADDKSRKIKQAAAEDGVRNPSGIGITAFSAAYLAFVPVTSYLARTGILSSLVEGTARCIPGFSNITGRTIPALSTLYVFWTFGASGAISAAGQAMGREEGLDPLHPRKYVNSLEGLPLRMFSAHYGLVENFAPFALAAALTQLLAPNNRELANLLGYHVLVKLFVYYPCYIFGINAGAIRSFAHISANGALINALWRLATGAS